MVLCIITIISGRKKTHLMLSANISTLSSQDLSKLLTLAIILFSPVLYAYFNVSFFKTNNL